MAEYNIQMNRYVASSDSYDKLYPKTKTVDVVDQNGDNLDTLLADKQDEILISGILKGNGAGGVSAAVAGTDFAPAGFGLGGNARFVESTDDLNNITANGWYYFNEPPAHAPTIETDWWSAGYSYMRVDKSVNGVTQTIYCSNTASVFGCVIKRYLANEWCPWEWLNPPMAVGVAYRTTERRNGNPVYKKIDSNGIVYWSTDQSTWYAEQSSLSITKQELVSSDTTPSINGQINWTYG